jgi:hypothetical protein
MQERFVRKKIESKSSENFRMKCKETPVIKKLIHEEENSKLN